MDSSTNFFFGDTFKVVRFITIVTILFYDNSSYYNHTSGAVIVLIVGIFYYFYLVYISAKLQQKNNWRDIICNPLVMVATSAVTPSSGNAFDKCLQYRYNQQIDKKIDTLNKTNKKQVEDSKNKINDMLKDTSDDDDEALQTLSDDIKELKDKLDTNQPAIEEVKSDLTNVITTMNTLFDGIKNSDLVNNLKIQND